MTGKKWMVFGIAAVILIAACAGWIVFHWQTPTSTTGQNREEEERSQNSDPSYSYGKREIDVTNKGQNIYGVAYVPKGKSGEMPLVICCHGLGGSYIANEDYAVSLASRGIAAYCFDFRGGGGSRSDGKTTDMSIMTEVSDIEAVLDAASQWKFVDPDQVVLLGTSQGGAASAIAAARHKDEIAGAILLYPAFLMHDEIHRQFASLDDVPDSFFFRWITLGKIYAEDIWNYDVYEEIGNYDQKVLLMHGDQDDIVPIRYSERASRVYPDADYYVIPGAGHGFYGESFRQAEKYIIDYLQEIKVL